MWLTIYSPEMDDNLLGRLVVLCVVFCIFVYITDLKTNRQDKGGLNSDIKTFFRVRILLWDKCVV